jgi:glutamyl-tRNA synthetase
MTKNNDSVYRFAPSPTGVLHVGGARTAIFNWLMAMKTGGKLLLRIEDTDLKRSTPESLRQIIASLEWLGVKWYGEPIFQSQQQNHHINAAHKLLEEDKAYRCFCTPERLAEERKKTEKKNSAFLYDRKCRKLTENEIQSNLNEQRPFVIRLKVEDGQTRFDDIIRGTVIVNHSELDDFILLRSNGTPVYHLAVVVDDHNMDVTHVIRGDDHLSNTPKQILIYNALGLEIPEFAHVPLLNGNDGSRLSKRHGATSIEEYKNAGFLPEALFNYLCLLGWSPGGDKELMETEELISLFSLQGVNKKNAIFDEQKLKWINGKYLSKQPASRLYQLLQPYFINDENQIADAVKKSVLELIDLVKTRAQAVPEIYEKIKFLLVEPQQYEVEGVSKYFNKDDSAYLLGQTKNRIERVTAFTADSLEGEIRDLAAKLDIKAGILIHPLRLALTGQTVSPGIFDVLQILGKESVIRRLDNALDFIHSWQERQI